MLEADGDRVPDGVKSAGDRQPCPVGFGDRLAGAIELAFRHLGRGERTVGEMRRHLQRKRVQASVVDRAIATLFEDGYLDDARFARLFADEKRELEQWGADLIECGLLGRGIDRELVDSVVAARDSEAELERALALLRRRVQCVPHDRRERALGVLLRKGYDAELALQALLAFAGKAAE